MSKIPSFEKTKKNIVFCFESQGVCPTVTFLCCLIRRTVEPPDIIVERKGTYRVYDLKTITGESSAINQLRESIGQCNQIIMNMATNNYNARQLGKDIRQYYVINPNAVEVMIFKGGRQIIVKRGYALSPNFVKVFMMRYNSKKSR